MATIGPVNERLSADLERLEREHLLVLELESLEHLLCEPDRDPFVDRRGPHRSGIDDAVSTLRAARRLPDEVTVRVLLPPGAKPSIPTEQAQAALRRIASDRGTVDWREANAVRNMGRRQLPLGILIAAVSAVVAYSAAAAATDVDNVVLKGLL